MEELRYHHFSHDHRLDYTKLQPQAHAKCSGCRQTILPGNFYYKCKLCGFYLHQVCFNMPQNVTHPSDHPTHNLTLQTFPKLPIKCKACEKTIKGFYYGCSKCVTYYHTLCLAAPLSVKTPSHRHSLNIEFVPVYEFKCDLCAKPSYSGWVYHCNLCEFDAHLSCVLTNKGSPVQPQATTPDYARADQRRSELIDLLTRGSNPPQDQSTLLSSDQDHAMQSFQLSEACFSIDFQKSLLDQEEIVVREVGIPEEARMSTDDGCYEESKRSEKSRGSSYSQKSASGGIGAHIWTELEEATEKRNSNSRPGDTKVESITGRRKYMCCFMRGKIPL